MGKGKQFGYLCFDKSKFGHLEEEVKKLLKRRDSVQYMVDVAKLNGKRLKGVFRIG